MKNFAYIVLWSIGFWLAGCYSKAPSEFVSAEFILKPLEDANEITTGIDNFIDTLEIIPIKDSNISLSSVSKILLDGQGNLYVLDFSGHVLSFDKQGEVSRVMPQRGRASNEYIRATDICLSNRELMILDEPVVRCFNLENLDEVRSIELPLDAPVDAIAPFDTGGVYLYSAFSTQQNSSGSKTDYLLSCCDSRGNMIEKYIKREDVTFSMFNISQARHNRYFLRPQNSTNLFYCLAPDGPRAVYKLDFGKNNIPKRYYYNVAGEDIVKYTTSDYYKLPMELHETTSHLYFRVAGKGAVEECFIYNLTNKHALRWKELADDYELKIQGADDGWFYAIAPRLDGESKRHGPLYSYVEGCFRKIDNPSPSQLYIIKIKFT